MKTQNLFGLLVGAAMLVFTIGCSNLSEMDVETKAVTVRKMGTNVVEETTFTHRDKSKVRNAGPVRRSWGGNILHFDASLGGGTPTGDQYGYFGRGYRPPVQSGGPYGYWVQ